MQTSSRSTSGRNAANFQKKGENDFFHIDEAKQTFTMWSQKCLKGPHDVFKGYYQHNWRTLVILTFSYNYSRPEIKFYE